MVFAVVPFPEHALPRVWMWLSRLRDVLLDDFGPSSLEDFIRQWNSDRSSWKWAVMRGEDIEACVSFCPWSTYVGSMQFVVPPHRWHTATTAVVLRAAIKAVFERGFGKVLTFPFTESTSVIHMLKRVPFRREGTLKEQTLKFGKPVNVAVFGTTPKILMEVKDAVSVVASAVAGGSVGRSCPENAETELGLEAVH